MKPTLRRGLQRIDPSRMPMNEMREHTKYHPFSPTGGDIRKAPRDLGENAMSVISGITIPADYEMATYADGPFVYVFFPQSVELFLISQDVSDVSRDYGFAIQEEIAKYIDEISVYFVMSQARVFERLVERLQAVGFNSLVPTGCLYLGALSQMLLGRISRVEVEAMEDWWSISDELAFQSRHGFYNRLIIPSKVREFLRDAQKNKKELGGCLEYLFSNNGDITLHLVPPAFIEGKVGEVNILREPGWCGVHSHPDKRGGYMLIGSSPDYRVQRLHLWPSIELITMDVGILFYCGTPRMQHLAERSNMQRFFKEIFTDDYVFWEHAVPGDYRDYPGHFADRKHEDMFNAFVASSLRALNNIRPQYELEIVETDTEDLIEPLFNVGMLREDFYRSDQDVIMAFPCLVEDVERRKRAFGGDFACIKAVTYHGNN